MSAATQLQRLVCCFLGEASARTIVTVSSEKMEQKYVARLEVLRFSGSVSQIQGNQTGSACDAARQKRKL